MECGWKGVHLEWGVEWSGVQVWGAFGVECTVGVPSECKSSWSGEPNGGECSLGIGGTGVLQTCKVSA